MQDITFNKSYWSGSECRCIGEAVKSGGISGDDMLTKRGHTFFEQQKGVVKVLLRTSSTDVLELAALLLDLEPGDEVIMSAHTFACTLNTSVLWGAKNIFAGSGALNLNLDVSALAALITPLTRAIGLLHYVGIACDMDPLLVLAAHHDLKVVEDTAQAIDSYYFGVQQPRRAHSTYSTPARPPYSSRILLSRAA